MELKNVKPFDNYNDLKAQFNVLKRIVISKSAEIEVYIKKIEEFSVENKTKQMYTEEDLKEMLHHALYTPKRDGYLININDSIVRETIAKFKKK